MRYYRITYQIQDKGASYNKSVHFFGTQDIEIEKKFWNWILEQSHITGQGGVVEVLEVVKFTKYEGLTFKNRRYEIPKIE